MTSKQLVLTLAAALGLALTGLGQAQAQSLTSISPKNARLDVLMEFTATGSAMSAVSIEGCTPDLATPPLITANQVNFRCTPHSPGPMAVRMAGVTGPERVMVDHPTRLGNPAARGMPAVAGVSLFNGNYFHEANDMTVAAKGMPFTVSRAYNSYYFSNEADLGAVDNHKPWRFNWDLRIGFVQGSNDKRVYVQRPDGSGLNFFKHADGQWYPIDQGSFDRLVFDVKTAQVSLYLRSGQKQLFSAPTAGQPGKLLSQADHHGNGFTLSYGSNGKVAAVTDPSGARHRFTYDDGARLTSVTDSSSRSVKYGWECQPSPCSGAAVQERLKTVTDVRGKVTTYNYSAFAATGAMGARSMLTSITDPRGNSVLRLSYSPDVYGNWGVSSVANGVGDTWRFAFCAAQADGSCASVVTAERFKTTLTPPLGAHRSVEFNTAGRPVLSSDGLGHISQATPTPAVGLTATTYNQAALLQAKQTSLGVAEGYATYFEYTPDRPGTLATVVDANDAFSRFTWGGDANLGLACLDSRRSPLGRLTQIQNSATCLLEQVLEPGAAVATRLSYSRSHRGYPDAVIDPLGQTTAMVYDSFGNLSQRTGAMGEVTRYSYNRVGHQLSQTAPDGGVTKRSYDPAGLLLSDTDPLGRVTSYAYDASGNQVSRTDALGQVTSYTYDAANRLTGSSRQISTGSGPQLIKTAQEYDPLGRVVRSVNPNLHADTSSYDDAGNLIVRANALNFSTRYEYDADNRPTLVVDPVGRETRSVYDRLGRIKSVTTTAGTQSYDYDDDGRVTRHTDARGNVTRYAYHPGTGRLDSVTDALGARTSASYDEAGNILSITDPNGSTTNFIYDRSNRRTKRIDANGHVWATEYDASGRVTKSTAPGGLITAHVFNLAGQLTQTRLHDGQVLAYSYDELGRRKTMGDATGTTSYEYDGAGRLTRVTHPNGKAIAYAYDPAGNRTGLTYPHGKTVSYGFDAAERLVTVTDWLNKVSSYTLNTAGQVVGQTLGNGSKASMVYDGAGRLATLLNAQGNGAVISSHALTLDGNGNIEQATVQLPLLPSFSSGSKTMKYDAANRLLTADDDDAAPSVAASHDDAGRMTGFGAEGFVFDARDLLTSVSGGVMTSSYVYNGDGHRVARTVAGVSTRHVVDPNAELPNLLAETDAAGALQRSYIYGYGLLAQISAADVSRYYHFDPTGHTLALTDAAGAVSDKYAYTPYGETSASGMTVNPFRYVGKYGVMEDGNGLHFMRARYYRADIARFVGLDKLEGSIDKAQALNRYAYVLGNPVMGVDPSGLNAVLAGMDYISDGIEGMGRGAWRGVVNIGNGVYDATIGAPATELRKCAAMIGNEWELANGFWQSSTVIVGGTVLGVPACAGGVAAASLSVPANVIKGELQGITAITLESDLISGSTKTELDATSAAIVDVGMGVRDLTGLKKGGQSISGVFKQVLKKPGKISTYEKLPGRFQKALFAGELEGAAALQSSMESAVKIYSFDWSLGAGL